MKTVTLYDTTLRDGSQAEGISFSSADKLLIARKLDEFGVHYIEGGWPGSNPEDIDFFAQIRSWAASGRASPPSGAPGARRRPWRRI